MKNPHRIAVVGGGIFGITVAYRLAELGYKIDLFEKNGEILSSASRCNQFRVHRGYHYPRSKPTAMELLGGIKRFEELYGECLSEDFDHYYCIAKKGSLTSPKQFIEFCDELNLEYEFDQPDVIKKNSISLCVKVKESLISYKKLVKFCNENLQKYRVNVIFKKFYPSDIENYDFVIVAAYANQNYLLEKYPEKQVDYQFEVVEKLVLKLPASYKNISAVILDGPFMCIDPFVDTEFHLMGNVEAAIHSRNIGKFPKIPPEIEPLLDKGIIRSPKVTKIKGFLSVAKEFFVGIKNAKYVGSMFTVRTVYPYHEHDDARPTVVERIDDKLISVYSGKIPTCVATADEVVNMLADELGVNPRGMTSDIMSRVNPE